MMISPQQLFRRDPIPRKYIRQLLTDDGLLLPAMRAPLTAQGLRTNYPDGVPMAIWHNATKKAEMYTFSGAALRWATTWSALGPTLDNRRTWKDDAPLGESVLALNDSLRRIAQDDGCWTKIRTLAIFTHGQTTGILFRKTHIQTPHLDALVAQIGPALRTNVRVILFACNTGRTPGLTPQWLRESLDDGGSTSFAAALRDRLVAAGKPDCEVWSHTTKGHTAYNSALRVFRGSDGAGSDGVSFARVWVHDWSAEFEPRSREAVAGVGMKIGPADEARFLTAARSVYRKKLYRIYGATSRNKELLVDGHRLAMAAPMNPDAVGAVLRQSWDQRWKARRDAWGKEIAMLAKLHA